MRAHLKLLRIPIPEFYFKKNVQVFYAGILHAPEKHSMPQFAALLNIQKQRFEDIAKAKMITRNMVNFIGTLELENAKETNFCVYPSNVPIMNGMVMSPPFCLSGISW